MTSTKTNEIIRASAGAGKTYTLSDRFLQLIVDAPTVDGIHDTILASTFTRKAAGEISDRILEKFAAVAIDPKHPHGKGLRYPWAKEKIKEELRRRLAHLARNLYRLRIGTLDAYFNKIAAVSSLELGMPPGWSILDDSEFEPFVDEAVREVFEDSARNRNDARKLLHLLQDGREEASVAEHLSTLAKDLLLTARNTVDNSAAWEHARPERLGDLTSGMLKDEVLQNLLEELEAGKDDLPRSKPKKKEEFGELDKRFAGVHQKLIDEVGSNKWDVFLDEKIVESIAATSVDENAECSYYNIPFRAKAPKFFNAVRALIPHAKGYVIKVLLDRTTATRDLLRLVLQKLDAILFRERKFRFDDITRLVAEGDFRNQKDVLDLRLNAETWHLQLDEFQDTSKPQWSVLEPLVQDVARSAKGSFFCVGDVKQAIYGWRGGVAAIFGTLEDELKKGNIDFVQGKLDASWRSAQPIIDTVNNVFENIDGNEAVKAASEQAGIVWKGNFNRHSTNKAKDFDGYCVLEESRALPNPENDEQEDDVETSDAGQEEVADKASLQPSHIDYVVERIIDLAKILENRPALKKGLGVIVFTNDMAGKIVGELKKRGIEASGGGGSLADSLAVRHVLSAMILADHPGDTTAAFHLARGPLAETLHLTEYESSAQRAACSQRIRHELTTKGYGEVVKKYVEILAPNYDAREFQRLEKLLELAYRFDAEASGIRTQTFVARVRKEVAVNTNTATIRVTTLHKAKGLEYDIVVLPQLARRIDGQSQTPRVVVDYRNPNNPTTPIDFVLRYPNKKIQTHLPSSYQKVFGRRIQREVEESLSELYVALTRATQQLVMIVPPSKTPGVDKTFDGILRAALCRDGKEYSAENILFEIGNVKWYGKPGKPVLKKEYDELDCRLAGKKEPHYVPRIVPSRAHRKPEKTKVFAPPKAVATPNWSRSDAMAWGTAIHACFERTVEWLDQTISLPDDAALRKIVEESLRGRPVAFTSEEVVTKFKETCAKPEIVKALSMSRYSPSVPVVERERRFAVWIGGKIMHGSVDRLVVCRSADGSVKSIEILDYKSDANEDVAALVDAYSEQLSAYRKGIAVLYGVDLNNVKATFVFVTLGRVENVREK